MTSPFARIPIANGGRKLFPKAFMEHMPFKIVNKQELYELMCTWDYNPTFFYPKGVRKRKNEQGHNAMYRFVLDKPAQE